MVIFVMLIDSCMAFSIRRSFCLAFLVVCLAFAGRSAAASEADDAKSCYNKGLSAYALGNYVEAATWYEKAFTLAPDPALLYDAAQAHRLAGNKQRALMLYQNYLSVFGPKAKNHAEVELHIAELKRAIDAEVKATNSPSLAPAPMWRGSQGAAQPRETSPTSVPIPSQFLSDQQTPTEHNAGGRVEATGSDRASANMLGSSSTAATTKVAGEEQASTSVDLTSAPETRQPAVKRTWIWGVVVAVVVVVGLGVGLGVGLSAQPSDPAATFGVARVQ